MDLFKRLFGSRAVPDSSKKSDTPSFSTSSRNPPAAAPSTTGQSLEAPPAFALWKESGAIRGLWIQDYATTQDKVKLKTIVAGYVAEGLPFTADHYAQIELRTYSVARNEGVGGGWMVAIDADGSTTKTAASPTATAATGAEEQRQVLAADQTGTCVWMLECFQCRREFRLGEDAILLLHRDIKDVASNPSKFVLGPADLGRLWIRLNELTGLPNDLVVPLNENSTYLALVKIVGGRSAAIRKTLSNVPIAKERLAARMDDSWICALCNRANPYSE